MNIDLLGEYADRAYPLLASLVVPRPIAWVSTLDEEGGVNVAPFSFFNLMGANPPLVVFAPGNRENGAPKDSARNARRTGEFVVNLVDEALAEAMNRTAATLPPGISEAEEFGLATVASELIATPRLRDVPAALECKVHSIQVIGENRMIIGIVHRLYVRDELVDLERMRIVQENYNPVGRMSSPDWYCRTGDRFEMRRPL
ncbi:MAG: flavin reductase family protein [Akkermansiaceae bacterium]|nr:flavin reductase family protein [Akkermansiaceae bacterium]